MAVSLKSETMDELLETFELGHSLSMKGCPYDNAVAAAINKVMKTEFINPKNFRSLHHLGLELYDYVSTIVGFTEREDT
ncbi:hypothetical protein [Paenibacillus sinensis]|uniref:hypothetical protein n=1 Tax=Paenibacillus sinensis TaxID=2834413 RepID=UPI001CA9BB92|nr:hypothetical protein [Paenibacillus sinensis]